MVGGSSKSKPQETGGPNATQPFWEQWGSKKLSWISKDVGGIWEAGCRGGSSGAGARLGQVESNMGFGRGLIE